MSFATDKAKGEQFENWAKAKFQTLGYQIIELPTKHKHDFIIHKDSLYKSVECKCQFSINKYGSLFFETHYRGEETGLLSGCYYMVIGCPELGVSYITETAILVDILRQLETEGSVRMCKNVGDGGKVMGYKMPIPVAEKYLQQFFPYEVSKCITAI